MPPIYFYIPKSKWLADMPQSADDYWLHWGYGVYCWTLQTYLRLQANGFPCQLVDTFPEQGIIFAFRKSLPNDLLPNSKSLLVCLLGDKGRHPYAQIHIVQNPQLIKPRVFGDRYLCPGDNFYLPLWTQTGLIPRDSQRGNRLENIAYFGVEANLASELRETLWQKELNALGLHLQETSRERWHDYSDVDVVLAVRSFHKPDYAWDFKPATKLLNAWHAGVPAILGCESAYRAERKSKLDYLEVNSPQEVITALKRLRDDPKLRQSMVENGHIRAQETQIRQLTQRWANLITTKIIPTYERWCSSSWYQQNFLQRRKLEVKTRGQRKALQRLRNSLGIRTRMQSLFSQVDS